MHMNPLLDICIANNITPLHSLPFRSFHSIFPYPEISNINVMQYIDFFPGQPVLFVPCLRNLCLYS